MLTEAGETFEQRETELQKLKDLVQEYEKRLETQVGAEFWLFFFFFFFHLKCNIFLFSVKMFYTGPFLYPATRLCWSIMVPC